MFRDGSYIDKTNNYHNIAKEPQTPEAALALQELRISDLLIRYNLTDRLLNKRVSGLQIGETMTREVET